jgi:hypothetical protein
VRSVQLVVTHNDHTVMYYVVPSNQGWRIDTATRQIVVGKGMGRVMIPLDGIRSYSIEDLPCCKDVS